MVFIISMNVNKTELSATKGFTIVHCRLWNMVQGSNLNWNRCICSSLIHQHLIHQHSCVFESNITKNYYFWPPISILLILFVKKICIWDLLRILVWDMVAMPGNFILLWRKFNKSGNFSVSQGKFNSFKWVTGRSLSFSTFSSITIVLISHVIFL